MTNEYYSNASDAIAASIHHDIIARVPETAENTGYLKGLCDSSVVTEEETEYWGTDENGYDWRVHAVTED